MKADAAAAGTGQRALAWISELAPRERRAFGACVGGWALDAMDVRMYSFVIPALIGTWGIARAPAAVLGPAALLVSAVGAWLAGSIGERFGRVRAVQVALLWFAMLTFLSGPAQNYDQVFLSRALLALAFG